jgi:Diguanylate cyclase, GGDEF domain
VRGWVRGWVVGRGVVRVSAGLTLVSVILSVLITTVIGFIMSHTGPGASGLTIAVAAPLLIAPVMSLQMLALLHRLDQTEERLRALSITDDLTQAFNRRDFITLAEAELARIRRCGGLCAIAILDLDDFKQINDTQRCRNKSGAGAWHPRRFYFDKNFLFDQLVPDGVVDQLGVAFQLQLLEHTRAIGADGLGAEHELVGDFLDRPAGGQPAHHLELAVR